MPYNPDLHRRRSLRLKHYDYSQAGAYFLTICAQNRECRFGDIVAGQFVPNMEGEVLQQYWQLLPEHFPDVELDGAVIMPNHVHGIVVITNTASKPLPKLENPKRTVLGGRIAKLGQVVAYFKYQTTKAINQHDDTLGRKIWQRNDYEHIIRNERFLAILRDYIAHNPQKWEIDQLNPKHQP